MRGGGMRGASSGSLLCVLNTLKDYFLTHLQLTLKIYLNLPSRLSSFLPLHTVSDRGAWELHRQLANLVLLDPGISGQCKYLPF